MCIFFYLWYQYHLLLVYWTGYSVLLLFSGLYVQPLSSGYFWLLFSGLYWLSDCYTRYLELFSSRLPYSGSLVNWNSEYIIRFSELCFWFCTPYSLSWTHTGYPNDSLSGYTHFSNYYFLHFYIFVFWGRPLYVFYYSVRALTQVLTCYSTPMPEILP